MIVDIFDYNLPPRLVAKRPVRPRDSAKLMYIGKGTAKDYRFYQLPEIINKDDILVFNNTRVIPARIYGFRAKKKIELLLHHKNAENIWLALAKPTKVLKIGDIITFEDSSYAKVRGKSKNNSIILEFFIPYSDFQLFLSLNGKIPIPPYLKRNSDERDIKDYQTIFASTDGSVAAPTAGLHFTTELINKLKYMGVNIEFITLHIGIGTFQNIKEKNITNHLMHEEYVCISQDVANRLSNAKASGKRIIAVGTTTLRALESASQKDGRVSSVSKYTNLFIMPGYKFNIVDLLITNFHLPKSTLMILISAFAGLDKIKKSYQYAIDNNYRFYSYGDACLIERDEFTK